MKTEPDSLGADEVTLVYPAFVSYRRGEADQEWARWLHRSLEAYKVPSQLVPAWWKGRRLRPIFLDEAETAASANLGGEIESALRRSRFLIVVCSPETPGSRWVDAEVRRFKELSR